jgi:hypothetical protein
VLVLWMAAMEQGLERDVSIYSPGVNKKSGNQEDRPK